MLVIKLLNLYSSDLDLSKIKLLVNKEYDETITGKELIESMSSEEIPKDKILRRNIDEHFFTIDCIDLQYYVFI
ncbi:hypothetical protein [Staphylococcus caprae]|uniref:hypothetical protein n=1 Tax=Staphylococcus caprae TaxID=29380 RepID=UPI001C8400DD|nr:hypothetical protein [Staphylococcus caprae]MBX5317023.1 hypothetical protein [Staphylococcus caprae]MBX5324328.1 hypothetical protein [Staphylococcus caprae]